MSSSKEILLKRINDLKQERFGNVAIKCALGSVDYELLCLTSDCQHDLRIMELLSKWRQKSEKWFQAIFKVTLDGTIRWFNNGVIASPDRLLFIIKINNEYIGHVGLFRFNFDTNTCEIDNIVRGESGYPGIMKNAINSMMDWGRNVLGIRGFFLQVLSDNERALKLYTGLNFAETKRDPLVCKKSPDRIEWVPAVPGCEQKITRYNVVMEYKNER